MEMGQNWCGGRKGAADAGLTRLTLAHPAMPALRHDSGCAQAAGRTT